MRPRAWQVTVLEAADEVGGGARSSEAILPGLLHDHCSAIHPMAVGSPFLGKFNLDRYGLTWRWPEIDCVHPLDGGSAGVLHRSVEQTAAGLGRDGSRWQRAFGYPASRFDALNEDIMGPLLRIPHHPLMLARFGAPTVLPASTFARVFRTDEGRALFGGVAAHAFRPLHYPMTSAIGMGIIAAGHRHGWPVAEGGSQSITNAMVALLTDLGAKIETGVRIEKASQLPPADVTMFDLAPEARSPASSATVFRAEFRAPSASSGVVRVRSKSTSPSTAACPGRTRTPTGPAPCTWPGPTPNWPRPSGISTPDACPSGRSFWSVSNIWPIRNGRSGNVHPVWSYAHVPNGYTGDATEAIIAQIERFAPGFRDRIVGSAVRTTTEFASGNPNYVGGDIMTGAKDIRQLTFGPRITLSPYHWGAWHVHLLGGHSPRPGRARHVRCQRGRLALAYLNSGKSPRRS